MSTKFFTCTIFCLLIFRPAVVVNSQTPVSREMISEIHHKEEVSKRLRKKGKIGEHEVNQLLTKYIEVKSNVKKKRPIYKRIFRKKSERTKLITTPVPVKKIDTAIMTDKIDSVPVIEPVKHKEKFFKRLLKIFK